MNKIGQGKTLGSNPRKRVILDYCNKENLEAKTLGKGKDKGKFLSFFLSKVILCEKYQLRAFEKEKGIESDRN